MLNVKKIEVCYDWQLSDEDHKIYTIKVNGEVFLECLGEDEVKELSIDELERLYEEVRKANDSLIPIGCAMCIFKEGCDKVSRKAKCFD